ncbi:hypothetical protein ACQP2T_57690 [Nonomuraea sp. CA-143628]|uniref:hypothetical protein n=1 Tax=Nonomuraea sp. CA-143628 TaxID=3239997 RepID=UPI003D8C436C
MDESSDRIYTAFEPRPLTALEQALEVVERDVRVRGITGTLRLITPGDGALTWVEFQGGYHGAGITADGDIYDRLADVAEAVQETIMELTWKVWPVCVTHDRGLHVDVEQEIAVWRCTGDATHTVSRVGELP